MVKMKAQKRKKKKRESDNQFLCGEEEKQFQNESIEAKRKKRHIQ